MACPRTATQVAALRGPFKFEMLVHVLCIFMLVLALALVLVLVLVRVDAGTGRLKSCYSNAQPSRLPLQLCRGNNKGQSSWYSPIIALVVIVVIVVALVVSFEVPSSSSAESNHAP